MAKKAFKLGLTQKRKRSGRRALSNGNTRSPEKPKTRKRRVRKPTTKLPSDDRFETALKYLREGRSQKRAAEIGMVSVGRFRRFLRDHKLAKRKGRKWIITDRRIREIEVFSEDGLRHIRVRGFGGASLTMRHRAAVQKFLDTNDISLLTPFDGQAVNDVSRQKHILETRPNVLYRIANAGSDADMKIYWLV